MAVIGAADSERRKKADALRIQSLGLFYPIFVPFGAEVPGVWTDLIPLEFSAEFLDSKIQDFGFNLSQWNSMLRFQDF